MLSPEIDQSRRKADAKRLSYRRPINGEQMTPSVIADGSNASLYSADHSDRSSLMYIESGSLAMQGSTASVIHEKKEGFFKRFLKLFKRKPKKRNSETWAGSMSIIETPENDSEIDVHSTIDLNPEITPNQLDSPESCSVPELEDEAFDYNQHLSKNSNQIKSDRSKERLSEDVSVQHQDELHAENKQTANTEWQTHMLNVQVTYNGYRLSPAQKNWLGQQVTGLVNVLLDKQEVPKNMSFVDDGVLSPFVPRHHAGKRRHHDIGQRTKHSPHPASRVVSNVKVEIKETVLTPEKAEKNDGEKSPVSSLSPSENDSTEKDKICGLEDMITANLLSEMPTKLSISEKWPSTSCTTSDFSFAGLDAMNQQKTLEKVVNNSSARDFLSPQLSKNETGSEKIRDFKWPDLGSSSIQQPQFLFTGLCVNSSISSKASTCSKMSRSQTPQRKCLKKVKPLSRTPNSLTSWNMDDQTSFLNNAMPINQFSLLHDDLVPGSMDGINSIEDSRMASVGSKPSSMAWKGTFGEKNQSCSDHAHEHIGIFTRSQNSDPGGSPSSSPLTKKRLTVSKHGNVSISPGHSNSVRFAQLHPNESNESITTDDSFDRPFQHAEPAQSVIRPFSCEKECFVLAKPQVQFGSTVGLSPNFISNEMSSSDESLAIRSKCKGVFRDRSAAWNRRDKLSNQDSEVMNRGYHTFGFCNDSNRGHDESHWRSTATPVGYYVPREISHWQRNQSYISHPSPGNFRFMPLIPYPTGFSGQVEGMPESNGILSLQRPLPGNFEEQSGSDDLNSREGTSAEIVPKRRKWRQCVKEKSEGEAWWMPRNWAMERGIGKYSQRTDEEKKEMELEIAKDANIEQIRMRRFVPL